MKYHYVYIITNKTNNKFYIGKHSTNDINDGYMGSGVAIRKAIKKYGVENFTKRILCFCNSYKDALKVEEFLVTEYIINRDDCYNMKCGGVGTNLSTETKEKIRKSHLGKKLSNDTKLKLSESHKGDKCYWYGKHFSETHLANLSSSRKGRIPWNKGKHISEETKRKISETKRKTNLTL